MRITKGEKLLYVGGLMCFAAILLLKVFMGAIIGNYKMDIEQLKYDLNAQDKSVQSLTMQVNEMTSFDNVKDVVKELGLAYNNDNIVIIND